MAKKCDNTSAAVVVKKGESLLMIERKKYNFGFALPAGHQDGDDPLTCAKKELSEEVGLTANSLQENLKISLPNPCKREGGTYHVWTVFEAIKWSGDIKPSTDETKSYIWASKEEINKLARRLEEFAGLTGILLSIENIPKIVKALNSDAKWEANPGLEPPMYFLFKGLKLI